MHLAMDGKGLVSDSFLSNITPRLRADVNYGIILLLIIIDDRSIIELIDY